ncbi:MAG: arsenite efflux transporter metallochaperone ArsD [Planctomycetales bacterium]|nr:arsenite efflux transporter metallochaperone ArsD [Planctomycetales bacterium]
MMTIQVFDKPMCCSTGICGAKVDQTLVRFAADLDWLRRQGVQVERFNLSQQPREFAQQADVRSALQTKGMDALPIVRVDGRIVCQGMYPSRQLLASWGHVVAQEVAPIPAKQDCCSGSGCC